jgi:hypothetical protein
MRTLLPLPLSLRPVGKLDVVLRFRLHLESPGLAAGKIDQKLTAVGRLTYEAADSGLLSPELAAGISRQTWRFSSCASPGNTRRFFRWYSSRQSRAFYGIRCSAAGSAKRKRTVCHRGGVRFPAM